MDILRCWRTGVTWVVRHMHAINACMCVPNAPQMSTEQLKDMKLSPREDLTFEVGQASGTRVRNVG